MKAARIHNFGGPEVIVVEDLPVPVAGPGEVLVRVAASGVGPWDALIREGESKCVLRIRSAELRIGDAINLIAILEFGYARSNCFNDARQVRSEIHPRRFSLRCRKLGPYAEAGVRMGDRVYPIVWYRRERKRAR